MFKLSVGSQGQSTLPRERERERECVCARACVSEKEGERGKVEGGGGGEGEGLQPWEKISLEKNLSPKFELALKQ